MKQFDEIAAIPKRIIPYLRELGFAYISQNIRVRSAGGLSRVDAVAYRDAAKSEPYVVVEFKSKLTKRLTRLDPAVQQAFRYSTTLGDSVRYLLISDGWSHYWFERGKGGQTLTRLASAPQPPGPDPSFTPSSEKSLEDFSVLLDPEDFYHLVRQLLAIYRDHYAQGDLKTYTEISKLLIAKLHDEKLLRNGERQRTVFGTIDEDELFQQIIKSYVDALADRRTSGRSKPIWNPLSKEALVEAGQLIRQFQLTSVSTSVRGDFFWKEFQELLPHDARSEFTSPQLLSELLVTLVDPQPGESILDPACGTGLFLVETYRYIQEHYAGTSRLAEEGWSRIVGIELNPEVAELATLNVLLNELHATTVVVGNAFDPAGKLSADVATNSFDVLITDPPLGPRVQGPEWQALAERLPVRTRRSEVLMFQQAYQYLKAGGRMAIPLPDSVLSARSELPFREWVLNNLTVKAIISLPVGALARTSLKTSIVLVEKSTSNSSSRDDVLIAEVQHFRGGSDPTEHTKWDLLLLLETIRNFHDTGLLEETQSESDLRTWTVDRASLDPLRLDVLWLDPARKDLARRLRYGDYAVQPLEELVDIVLGVALSNSEELEYQVGVVIRAQNVLELEIELADATALRMDAVTAKRAKVKRNDVLVTLAGSLPGRAAVFKAEISAIASRDIAILRVRDQEKLDPEFLAAAISSDIGRDQLGFFRRATFVERISVRDLEQVLVPLPPLQAQRDLTRRMKAMLNESKELKRSAHRIDVEARNLVFSELFGDERDA